MSWEILQDIGNYKKGRKLIDGPDAHFWKEEKFDDEIKKQLHFNADGNAYYSSNPEFFKWIDDEVYLFSKSFSERIDYQIRDLKKFRGEIYIMLVSADSEATRKVLGVYENTLDRVISNLEDWEKALVNKTYKGSNTFLHGF